MAYQTVNPANNQLIKSYPAHSDADVEAALKQADALYHSAWAKGDIAQRLPVLHKLADLIDSRAEELAKIASQEMGKLIKQSRGEVKLCAQIARYYADNAERFLAPVKYPSESGEAWVEHHPIGVLMAVEPWNFPYYQLMRVLAPNLAAGNPVIAKHASIVPHCAETFAQLVREAGAPEGAWTNLFISQDQVAKIIADDRVQGVALTGSEKAGGIVAAQAAKHIKKATLELGGNAPFIVFDDADLDKAVEGALASKFRNAGQTCVCANRLYVQDGVYDRFAEKLQQAVEKLRIGDGLQDGVTTGPLIDDKAVAKVEEHIADALAKGARIVTGGKPHALGGNFFQPTILVNVPSSAKVAKEETFGPLAPLFRFKDEADVIAQANDTEFGLAAYFYARDLSRVFRVGEALEYGIVGINTGIISNEVAPFGGIKASGLGREGSKYGIEDYLEIKYMCIGL